MDTCPWRQKVRRRRSRRRRLALSSDKAICPESDASVKSIDAVLGKVCLPCLQPSKSRVHTPLLWSRQLDIYGTVAYPIFTSIGTIATLACVLTFRCPIAAREY